MDSVIGVGFGKAWLSKGDEVVWEENHDDDCALMTVTEAEALAAADPDQDWRIHYYGPLSEAHYQRQGAGLWVLYAKGEGFA